MSNMAPDDIAVCANCGKGEENGSQLKTCTACKMVKYCNRECQIAHRPQHKKECRRLAAELHDEKLFKVPPPQEDCPICLITLPSHNTGVKYVSCCGKVICNGCIHAPVYDDQGNEIAKTCPFCRTPAPTSAKEIVTRLKKGTEKNEAGAFLNLGVLYSEGEHGMPQNYAKAFELYQKAEELGSIISYYNIGNAYHTGRGVERDNEKARHYWELAAMEGHVEARRNLAAYEEGRGRLDRALKHCMIAAECGNDDSLKAVQSLFNAGRATKDDYTKALRAYQTYIDGIRSAQRDEAAAFDDMYKYY